MGTSKRHAGHWPNGSRTVRWSMRSDRRKSQALANGLPDRLRLRVQQAGVHHDGIISPCNMLGRFGARPRQLRFDQDCLEDPHGPQSAEGTTAYPHAEDIGCENCEWTPYLQRQLPGFGPHHDRRLQHGQPPRLLQELFKGDRLKLRTVPWSES